MVKKIIWERALLISFFLHLVLVPCFSWALGNQLISQPKKEKIIELQVVSIAPKPKEKVLQQKKLIEPEKKIEQPKPLIHKNVVQSQKQKNLKPSVYPKKVVKSVMSSNHTPIAKLPGDITDQVKTSSPTLGEQQSEGRNIGEDGETKNRAKDEEPVRSTKTLPRQYVSPQLLRKVEPIYPSEAREKNREGTVIVKLQVLESGQVGEVSVKRSSGDNALDEAAIRAVKKWRFIPAKDKETGEPVKCFTSLPVVFHLQ